ncbi:unnamed protein product [Orchesella dallaii]|uniref:Secreted protein n=1 Tax=Orchesella dallaii TaxID=48710 RepID=A0ABP1RWQ9_9HEXA
MPTPESQNFVYCHVLLRACNLLTSFAFLIILNNAVLSSGDVTKANYNYENQFIPNQQSNLTVQPKITSTCVNLIGYKWVLYGKPAKCYITDAQGPCPFGFILAPLENNSMKGSCIHGSIVRKRVQRAVHCVTCQVTANTCKSNENWSSILKKCIIKPIEIKGIP